MMGPQMFGDHGSRSLKNLVLNSGTLKEIKTDNKG